MFHHLSFATYPPARAGHPQKQVYLVLQLAGGTATIVANGTGRLLPYLFTLAGPKRT